MSDAAAFLQNNEDQPAPQQAAGAPMHPAMEEFQSLPWPEAMQPWADETATRINDQMQRERVIGQNQALANNYAGNLDQFRQGLVNWTAANPQRADTALSLVRPSVARLIAHGDHDPAMAGDAHEALSSDIEGQIAQAAVTSWANIHADTARGELDRLGDYLDDNQKQYLGGYIGAQELARGTDAAAQQQMAARAAAQQNAVATLGHAASLYDPQSDDLRFPPGWAQRLTADPSVPWTDKGALMHLYGRLQADGDPETSDPTALTQAVHAAASGTLTASDLINAAGGSLRAGDAMALASAAGVNASPQVRDTMTNLAVTLEAAARQLKGRDGENGAAGQAAYGRFANWLMDNVRRLGSAIDLNPNSENYFLPMGNDEQVRKFWTGFHPTGDELIGARQQGTPFPFYGAQTADRPTLEQIFSRGGRPTGAPGEDQVIPTPRQEFNPTRSGTYDRLDRREAVQLGIKKPVVEEQ